MFSRLKKIIEQPDIAVDLGTANTRMDASELENITEAPSLIRHVYYNDEVDVYFELCTRTHLPGETAEDDRKHGH